MWKQQKTSRCVESGARMIMRVDGRKSRMFVGLVLRTAMRFVGSKSQTMITRFVDSQMMIAIVNVVRALEKTESRKPLARLSQHCAMHHLVV